ncbi:MAG: hypothetical protein JWR59_2162 [Brevundimonas sp.]|nr:hypothetical protein [Brevundimonas sp.]
MTARLTSTLAILTALGGGLLLAGSALAQVPASGATPQETPAQARARTATSSLNGAPAETTLAPRPNALPPLSDAERPHPVRPLMTPQAASRLAPVTAAPVTSAPVIAAPARVQTRTQTRPETPDQAQAPATAQVPAKPQAPSITLAPGATQPEPIAMPLGYYVRGDKACNQVWPGEGDLAWFTPAAFTIDFGGCEPGQFMQTGPNAWSEEQKCMTELGGDAGGYSVTYEVTAPGEVHRRAMLEIDESVEEDVWKHCEAADVPQEARFKD